jgi:hypothetical protein
MSITRIKSYGISDGAITTNKISGDVSLGVKIANVQIANSSYGILDDTAIALEGGYLVINGAGFASGCQVIVGANTATSTTFVNSTTIRAQVGAAAAGTKTLYVVNTDGGTAIRVNGLTYSATPTWVTGSTLPGAGADEAISIQLSANDATSYQLQTGSTLPTGLSLSANGLLSGTVTGIEEETTYNFTIEAIDDENQESPRSFSITITFGDLYFYATTLLLDGDGANGANNNTFVDSSNNNFAITRNGNVTQGTFSPFSAPDGRWSNYFDGSGDFFTLPSNSSLSGSGAFTFEFFVYMTATQTSTRIFTGGTGALSVSLSSNGGLTYGQANIADYFSVNVGSMLNRWVHIVIARNSVGSVRIWANGVSIGTGTDTNSYTSSSVHIGRSTSGLGEMIGYLSNLRLVDDDVYGIGNTSITVPTLPLTAVSSTKLLTCQSNRFKDNSTNNFTITPNGNVSVTSFAPFAPTGVYSAATNGGSGYFDGTGDYLTLSNNTAFKPGASTSFCVELWIYPTTTGTAGAILGNYRVISYPSNTNGFDILYNNDRTIAFRWGYPTYADAGNSPASVLNAWNHIVVCRESNTRLSCYLNGVRWFTSTSNIGITDSNESSFWVGWAGSLSGTTINPFPGGYISNVRMTKGSTPYDPAQTTLTLPNSPATNISDTQLLCNFTNAGILDYTRKNNLETVGTAQITTSEKKYGTGSILINSTSNAFKTNGVLLPGDFTIEGWFKGLQSGTEDFFILQGINATNGFLIGLTTQEIRWRSNGTSDVAYSISDSNWYHFAIVRNGSATNNVKVYYNGTQVTQGTYTNQILPSAGSLFIGPGAQLTAGFVSTGYLDDFRITAGIARYTSNFTPPISAHRLR